MNEQIKQIAERLVGLREVLDISVEEIAQKCNISPEEYRSIESGEVDIPVGILSVIGDAYNIELTTLMFGDEPKMSNYFVTRRGKGTSVERRKAYKYQSLAAGFSNRKADPFIVTVHPNDNEIQLNTHLGEEFNMVLGGTMLLSINGKEIVLEKGDSIYFNAEKPHGMKALNGEKVTFLAVII